MKNYKTVVYLIVFVDGTGDFHPVARVHLRRIDGGIKLDVVDYVIEHLDFRHIIDEMREVEGQQFATVLVFNHSDCPTRVDDENVRLFVLFHRSKLFDLRPGSHITAGGDKHEAAVGIFCRENHSL